MTNVVIAGYARSPFTLARKGALARVRPDDMAAEVVRGLIEKTGVKPEDIEDIILGCAFPEGEQGMNVARLIGLLADLPLSVGLHGEPFLRQLDAERAYGGRANPARRRRRVHCRRRGKHEPHSNGRL